jgi:hypothetical protein
MPVIIHGDDGFDVNDINPASISVTESDFNIDAHYVDEVTSDPSTDSDTNGDGFNDLVVYLENRENANPGQNIYADVQGNLNDGAIISESVHICVQ